MRKKIRKYFIPHKENEFKPHFLRKASVVGMAVFVGFIFIASVVGQQVITSPNLSTVISSVLVDLTNADRVGEKLNSLAVNSKLEEAARLKAQDMAEKGYFAHESPDGKDPWHWLDEAGYSFAYAGENLAVDFSDSVDVERAWMNSPGHRANILHNEFTEIGIATARGTYNGRETTFVVQMFGRPAGTQPTPIPKQSPAQDTVTNNQESTTNNSQPASNNTSETVAGVATPTPEGIKTVIENDAFIAVENVHASPVAEPYLQSRDYATWYEVILTSPHTTLKYVYTALAVLVLLALLLLIFVEIRKQHLVHVVYGVVLLLFILALLYVGRTFIFPEVLIL